MNVIPTGAIFYGVCQVLSEYCSAREGGAVTAVHTLPTQGQINVCKICLDHQIRNRDWKIEGASVTGMREQLDIAVVDDEGKVLVAVEVKNWGHPTQMWAKKIAAQMIARQRLASIPFFSLVTPSYSYVWQIADGTIIDESLVEIDITSSVHRISEQLGIVADEFLINDGAEFKHSPFLAAKKHMQLERIMKHLFEDKEFISRLPENIFNQKKNTEVLMEYVLPKN